MDWPRPATDSAARRRPLRRGGRRRRAAPAPDRARPVGRSSRVPSMRGRCPGGRCRRVRPGHAPDLVALEGVAEAVPPVGQALTQRRRGVRIAVPIGHEPDLRAVGGNRRGRAAHHPWGGGSGPQGPPEHQAGNEDGEQEYKSWQPPARAAATPNRRRLGRVARGGSQRHQRTITPPRLPKGLRTGLSGGCLGSCQRCPGARTAPARTVATATCTLVWHAVLPHSQRNSRTTDSASPSAHGRA
jgi:hypothetical protein